MNTPQLTSAEVCTHYAELLATVEENVVKLERLPATSRDRQALAREFLTVIDNAVSTVLIAPEMALDFGPFVTATDDLRDRVRELIL